MVVGARVRAEKVGKGAGWGSCAGWPRPMCVATVFHGRRQRARPLTVTLSVVKAALVIIKLGRLYWACMPKVMLIRSDDRGAGTWHFPTPVKVGVEHHQGPKVKLHHFFRN